MKIKLRIKNFSKSEYMTSVIFDDKKNIGKVVKVRITRSNRNTLIGEMSKISIKGSLVIDGSTKKIRY